jgi:uncharacterized membrane protein YeaQ/YmgE (transglycosylase-associated protein family)
MGQVATIISLIIGAIAGWVAAKVLKRTGFGVVGDVVVGTVGGFVGAWVWTFLHPPGDSFDLIQTVAASAVGAIVLLVLWRLARR